MPRYLYPDRMKALLRKAVQHGATVRPLAANPKALPHWEWSVSANCSKPVTVEFQTRPELRKETTQVITSGRDVFAITMETRCRQCENCLKARAAMWRYKAKAEWHNAKRSWLGTLTFSPERQFMALTRARQHLDAQGVDFEKLTIEEQFLLRHRETGREVTLFLKRLRKQGHKFRYVLVVEAHVSGLPHYHLVLHELGEPIRHKALKESWSSGFSDFKLIETPEGATYAVKYLTKSKMARVRASLGYGSPDITSSDIA